VTAPLTVVPAGSSQPAGTTACAPARRRRGARAAVVVLALAAGAALCGCSSPAVSSPAVSSSAVSPDGAPSPEGTGIGAWPTFLPSPTPDGLARGSATDPALSFPGSPVLADLGTGTVTVDVEGPSYPAGTPAGASQVACTFTVVFSDATTPVALGASRFDVLDHDGAVHPALPAPGTTVPPTLEPGTTVTLSLVSTVPSGEGLLRWAPDGTHQVAGSDYVAEPH